MNDNGTNRVVNSVSIIDADTIRIGLAAATTSTNITLTYAKDNSGENQDVLRDSTTGNVAA